MDFATDQQRVVITVDEDLDGSTFHAFQDGFDHFQTQPAVSEVVIDVSTPRYLHSVSIAAIIWAYKRCRKDQRKIALVARAAEVRRTLECAHVCALIPTFNSIDEVAFS
jgi:anti-anti-sigma factor